MSFREREIVTTVTQHDPPLSERDLRHRRVRQALRDASLDGLLAFAPAWRREHFRYVAGAGVRGTFAFAYLPLESEPVAFVSAPEDAPDVAAAGWVTDVRPLAAGELNAAIRARRLGVAHLELLPAALRDHLDGVDHVSATRLVTRLELVKSAWELERVRAAAAVCDAGWEAFVAALRPGVAEFEIVAGVEAELRRRGAEDNFMLIASGGDEVRGMTPAGPRRLQPGDMVRTELTPQLGGYYAQICRSAVVGTAGDGQRRSFELFREALEAGLDAVRAGVTAHEVARAQNDVFRRHGLGEFTGSQYTRVRGHGHGLHPDEAPPIVEGEDTVLPEGAVVIVHPNTFTPLAGYHVLGDPIVVTAAGHEPLLHTARRLWEVAP
jgi:Xaa-Pro aminopeptidase